MERTIKDIENEIVDVQNRIDALHKELREQKKFEVANNVKKGDIIQDTNGVKYFYQ